MSDMDQGLLGVVESTVSIAERTVPSPNESEEFDDFEAAVLGQKIPVLDERQEKLQLRSTQMHKLFDGDQGKSKRVFYRFRVLARLVLMAGHLVPKRYVVPAGVEELSTGLPHFDLNAYKRSKTHFHLPYQIKCILIRPSWLRSGDEVEMVDKHLRDLPFLQKYPRATQRAMSRVLRYQFVDAHRVVLRQGDMPISLYFVMSGALIVQIEEKDVETSAVVTRQVNKLIPGSVFGDIALVHNTPRTATVITKYPSEFLLLDKEDYDELLKASVHHHWTGCYNALSSLQHFSRWNHDELVDCSHQAKLVQFQNKEIVVGNIQHSQMDGYLYFVVDGKCRLVEMLCFMAPCDNTMKVPKRPIDVTSEHFRSGSGQPCPLIRRFLHVFTINTGDYFGAGEDLQWRYVVAWGKVECLQIPRSYLRRRGHGTWMELLSDKLESQLPTHKEIAQEYMGNVTWHTYKKHVMADLVAASRTGPRTQMTDVPLSIQQDEAVKNWKKLLT